MVFSSLPIFLDPPNWNQPPQCLVGAGSGDHHQLITPAGLAPPPAGPADASAAAPASSSLPAAPRQGVSMAERARLARIPLPEPGTLRCPRCDSANTKFCYFNNYSLSQPRHFCKSCRRYWTRGGALRNVPVGGGCRRNTKRSSKSKSSRHAAAAATPSSSAPATTAADVMSLHALAHLGSPAAALDASLEGYVHMPFHQPPVLHQGLPYPFADCDDGAFSTAASAASGLLAQLAAVKMEENGGGVGVVRVHEPYWGGGGWPGEFLSGFGSSPSGNVL